MIVKCGRCKAEVCNLKFEISNLRSEILNFRFWRGGLRGRRSRGYTSRKWRPDFIAAAHFAKRRRRYRDCGVSGQGSDDCPASAQSGFSETSLEIRRRYYGATGALHGGGTKQKSSAHGG